MNKINIVHLLLIISYFSFAESQVPNPDMDIGTDSDTSEINISNLDTVNLSLKSTLYKKGLDMFKEGLNAYMNRNYESAYETFEKVLKLDPLHEECFMLLHRAKSKLGIVEVEQDIAEDTTQSTIRYQQALFKEGLTAFINNDFTKAKRVWNRLYNLNPRHPHLKSYLRKVDKEISRLKKNKDARARIENLFKTGSNNYVNGNILIARTYLDSVLFFDSNHKDALSLLLKINEDILKQQSVQFRKGIMQYSQGAYREAIQIWKEALKIDKTNSTISNYIKEADTQLLEIKTMHLTEAKRHLSGKKLKRAIDEYDQILRFFPGDTETKNELADINRQYQREVKDKYTEAVTLFEQIAYEKAALLFENIIAIDPSFVAAKEYLQKCRGNIAALAETGEIAAIQNEAEQLEQSGKWEEAARKWQELIAIDPLHVKAHDRRDVCHDNMRKQRNSLELQKIFNRSVSLYQKGKITSAKELWNQILSQDPDNEMVLKMKNKIDMEIKQQLKRGNAFSQKEQWSRAIGAYRKVLAMDPHNTKAKQGISNAKQKQAQVKKTASAPKKVDTKVIEKLFNTGLDLYMSKKYKPALEEFNKIVALDPENTRAKSYIKNLKNKLDRLKNL